MHILDKLFKLSQDLSHSLLSKKNKKNPLESSDYFDDEQKEYITSQLTNKTVLSKRKEKEELIDKSTAWKKLKRRISYPKKQQYFRKLAAILVIGLGLSAFFYFNTKKENTIENNTEVVNKTIPAGTDKAILTLENGEEVALQNNNFKNSKISNDGKNLIYNSAENEDEKLKYNYLTIPRGGQYFVKLSDGTKIWLNSETQIKYPVQFVEETPRVVELLYGEVYLEVTKNHNKSKSTFIVRHKEQEVKVLGTAFNIKAYKDEKEILTTLAEGKIELSFTGLSDIMQPLEQYAYNTVSKKHSKKIVDLEYEISWKDGIFNFKRKSLEDIMMVLSRWYDVEVVFDNTDLKNNRFNGSLAKDQNLQNILDAIKSFDGINNYEVKNNKVILN
jgi:hypothetical protein